MFPTASLSDLCSVITDGSHFSPPTVPEGVPYVTVRDLADGHINFSGSARIDYQDFLTLESNGCRPRRGDVLFSKDGTVGKVATVRDDREFVVLSSLAILRPSERILPQYLTLALTAPRVQQQVLAARSGTALRRVVLRSLRPVRIPLPEVGVQRRIVEILEDHLTHLDAAADYESAALRRADLPDAGTQDGELAPLPEGWAWQRLGDIAEVVGGVTKDSKKQSLAGMVEVPYLRVANVQRGALRLDDVTSIRVSPQKADTLKLRAGDVLLNEGGDRDKLARGWVWQDEIPKCIHQNHVFRARLQIGLDPYFLSWTANTFGGRWAERNGKQSVNLASISLSMIRRMPVIVPPDGVSASIVADLHDLLEELDRLQRSVLESQARKDGLRRAILAAAFEGKLTGRHTDTEVIQEMAAGRREGL